MKISKLFVTTIASLFVLSYLHAAPYKVDIEHSSVGFKVKHLMISNVKGDFSDFNGTYDLENGKLTSLKGVVKTSSIDTGIEKRDNHLKSADFFDIEKYPEMTFTMVSATDDTITGDLTMHGVTKPVTFDAEISGTIKDPWGNTRSSISMEGKIKRSDFGLTYNQILEAGGVAISDEVQITIELEGIEQK